LSGVAEITPKEVAIVLFGPYILGVELASMLLLAGLIGAYHLGRRIQSTTPGEGEHL
jgi:NADH-quinone oxidoreductase subunit J